MDLNDQTSGNLNAQKIETRLKPVLSFRDLVFFYIVAIFGVRLLPAAAAAGPSIVFYFIISLAIFFIPLGLTVTDLSKRYPVEGGIYIWSKKAFGDFHGYITAWTYWTANLAFFPSILLFASSQVVFLFPGLDHLGNNSLFIGMLSVGIVLFILILNIIGLKTSTVFNNISGLATYASAVLIIVIGVISWIRFGPATDMSIQNWIPSMGDVKSLVFLSTVVYMFAGLESASMLGDEVHNASRTIPRAIVISGIIITCLYIFSTFSLMLAVPPDQLSDLTGTTNAVSIGAGNIGGNQLAVIATSLITILLILGTLGGVSVWLATTARLPFVVGLDRYLPSAFGKLHPRFGTPYVSLISLALVTIFFIMLSSLGEKAEQVYNILISLEIVTFLIPYLYMFASVVKFEADKKFKRKVDIPGGRKNAMAAGIVGFLVVTASLLLALVPGDDVEDPFTFYITISASLSFNMIVGIGLYLYAKRKRS